MSFLISQDGKAGGSIQIDNNRSTSHSIGGSKWEGRTSPFSPTCFIFMQI